MTLCQFFELNKTRGERARHSGFSFQKALSQSSLFLSLPRLEDVIIGGGFLSFHTAPWSLGL